MFFCTLDSCFQYAGAYLKRFTALLSRYSRPPAKTDPWTADRGPQTVERNLPSSLVMSLRTSELPQTRWGVTRNRSGSAGRRLDVKRL